jgi:competence protein ComEA
LLVFGLAIRAFAGGLLPPAPGPRVEPRRIDINRAGVAELQTLPGVGPSRAEAIVLERVRHGRFERPEDLERVFGIGPDLAASMLPFVEFGSPLPSAAPR